MSKVFSDVGSTPTASTKIKWFIYSSLDCEKLNRSLNCTRIVPTDSDFAVLARVKSQNFQICRYFSRSARPAIIAIMATIINVAAINHGTAALQSEFPKRARNEREFEELLADLFRQHGWRVKKEHSVAEKSIDLVVARGNDRYIIEPKAASEGRPDRLVPLLSQAILQARAYAQAFPQPAAPLAVIAAPAISPSAANSLVRFLSEFAPEVAVGILDRKGFRHFIGPGLEQLNAPQPRSPRRQKLPSPDSAYLFSDLSQWMLKVLLAPMISGDLLRAPRGEYRNASELAAAAEVSVMSAFRFIRQLRQEGFLDEHEEPLRLVRREELLRRWQAAHQRGAPELPLRWIIPAKSERQLSAALYSYSVQPNVKREPAPRVCLGLFAAAEFLGFGFVHAVPQHFYLESLDRDILKRMGCRRRALSKEPTFMYVFLLFGSRSSAPLSSATARL